jgi:aminoglycoside phosphotransferase
MIAVTSTNLTPLDEPSAERALAEACLNIPVDCAGAELIRIGSNATFRLRNDVIARVARSRQSADTAKREVMVSRWLHESGIPAVRALEIEQPILTSDRVVTFWESLGDSTIFGTTVDLARLLRGVHALNWKAELPQHDPFSRVFPRLKALDLLEQSDRSFLLGEFDRLLDEYSKITYALPPGVIHGDANVGNVLVDQEGVARLADLDGFAIGATEWDLILTAMYYERYGWHDAGEYEAFVDAYGFDIRGWDGYHTLSEVREFLMVTWLAQAAEANIDARRELIKRIVALKAGASRMDWLPL